MAAEDSHAGTKIDPYQRLRDRLLKSCALRGTRANQNLRTHITGTIQINCTDRATGFFFDWRGDDLIVEERYDGSADCTINLKANVLAGIIDGDLNPQIALLSDKLQVTGNMSFAVYIFNLISTSSERSDDRN